MDLCPCGSPRSYEDCCGPLIAGTRSAETAEQLMRSRYSAYVRKELGWLRDSLHPDRREGYDEAASREWAEKAEWHGIDILRTERGGVGDQDGEVEFVATFSQGGIRQEYHERSVFRRDGGRWFFESGKTLPHRPVVRSAPKAGRNDPCPCGSGKKYKKCCG